jgi:hypothetical protein
MKSRFAILALTLLLNSISRGADNDLRAFIIHDDPSETADRGLNKEGLIFADEGFLLFRSRDGKEVGRNVPAVWVSKLGFKWRSYLISESFGLGAIVDRCDISGGYLVVQFSYPKERITKTYKVKVVAREDVGLVFFDGVGLESQ